MGLEEDFLDELMALESARSCIHEFTGKPVSAVAICRVCLGLVREAGVPPRDIFDVLETLNLRE